MFRSKWIGLVSIFWLFWSRIRPSFLYWPLLTICLDTSIKQKSEFGTSPYIVQNCWDKQPSKDCLFRKIAFFSIVNITHEYTFFLLDLSSIHVYICTFTGNEWYGMCFLPKFFSYEHHYKTEIVQFIFLFSKKKKKTITIKKNTELSKILFWMILLLWTITIAYFINFWNMYKYLSYLAETKALYS